METLKKHWIIILIVIVFLYAVYTANRILAGIATVAFAVYMVTKKLFILPIFALLAIMAFLVAQWGGAIMQKLYYWITGKNVNTVDTKAIGAAAAPAGLDAAFASLV